MDFWKRFAANPPPPIPDTELSKKPKIYEKRKSRSAINQLSKEAVGGVVKSATDVSESQTPNSQISTSKPVELDDNNGISKLKIKEPIIDTRIREIVKEVLAVAKYKYGEVKDPIMMNLSLVNLDESNILGIEPTNTHTNVEKDLKKTKSKRQKEKTARWREQQKKHKVNVESAKQRQKGTPCRFYAVGKCHMGKHCPFKHDLPYVPLCHTIVQALRRNKLKSRSTSLCTVPNCSYIHNTKELPCIFYHSTITVCTKLEGNCAFAHKKTLTHKDKQQLEYLRTLFMDDSQSRSLSEMKQERRQPSKSKRQKKTTKELIDHKFASVLKRPD